MIPGSGGTQRALRLVGMTRAKLFMMTGQRIPATLAERAPLALRTLKAVLNERAEAPLDTALELERKAYAWLRSTHDYEEGVRAFLEKRPPKFTGR